MPPTSIVLRWQPQPRHAFTGSLPQRTSVNVSYAFWTELDGFFFFFFTAFSPLPFRITQLA